MKSFTMYTNSESLSVCSPGLQGQAGRELPGSVDSNTQTSDEPAAQLSQEGREVKV